MKLLYKDLKKKVRASKEVSLRALHDEYLDKVIESADRRARLRSAKEKPKARASKKVPKVSGASSRHMDSAWL